MNRPNTVETITGNESSNSAGTGSSTSEIQFEPTPQQLQQLAEIKRWIQNKAEFHGRTDDEFILVFLHGCKFDKHKVKKKMNMYYESRRKIPRWWANRDLNHDTVMSLLQLKITTALIDKNPNQPTVVITSSSHIGPNLGNFDDYLVLHSILLDKIMRRRNSQLNGIVWIFNHKNHKPWFGARAILLHNFWNIIYSFNLAVPIRIKKIISINVVPIVYTVHRLCRPFLSKKIMKRFHLCGSDWSALYDHVPRELLPEEYGGQAGPMDQHEDAFIKEIIAFNDYIVDDNQYGFRS